MGYSTIGSIVILLLLAGIGFMLAVHFGDPLRRQNKRGNRCLRGGRYDEAVEEYTKVIDMDPMEPCGFFNRGLAYQRKGEHNKALVDFYRALDIDPQYTGTHHGRGDAFLDKGDYDLAIEEYTRAIELDANYSSAYNNRGIEYALKGEFDRAEADLTKALEIDAHDAKHHYARGLLPLARKRQSLGRCAQGREPGADDSARRPQRAPRSLRPKRVIAVSHCRIVEGCYNYQNRDRFAGAAAVRGKEDIVSVVDEVREQVVQLCEKYRVKELYLFGSALRDDFGPQSDVDMAAVFSRDGIACSFDQYFDFKTALEHLLGRPVDLVCIGSVRNSVFQRELDETKRLIYAA
jgi:tetratricopeptide (TPR) repeat protein